MKQFKLGFRNKSALQQLVLCEQTLSGLAAKPELQLDVSHLAEAQSVVNELRTFHERVESLRGELKMAITQRNAGLREARRKILRASLGVLVKVERDPSKLLEAGLQLEASKTVPVGKPGAPENLRALPTDKEGEVRLTFKRPVRRCSFQIACRPDAEPDGWKLLDTSLRQKALVEGLSSGVKYWFRVRAINAHGEGPWSNLAPARVK